MVMPFHINNALTMVYKPNNYILRIHLGHCRTSTLMTCWSSAICGTVTSDVISEKYKYSFGKIRVNYLKFLMSHTSILVDLSNAKAILIGVCPTLP